MVKAQDYVRTRLHETYFKQAKKDNIRARSYFKLKQLDEKFDLIKDGQSIIDLGAAPGGWIQYIDQKITTGKIIGIDLLEIKKPQEFSDKVEVIQDDFAEIEDYIDSGFKFDLVLSDMAPEFSGNSQVDRGRTHKLNLLTLEFCKKHLKRGANCAFKTFEGEDLGHVRAVAKKIFEEIKEFKPASSQKKSAETFIICFSRK